MTTGEVALIVGGQLFGPDSKVVSGLVIDSRSATPDREALFFALRGRNHDGHNFLVSMAERGVRSFVAERIPEELKGMEEICFIKVDDTLAALQKLAEARRIMFGGRVIAVTGSAGKTIVKEWLAAIMSRVKHVVRSPRSYNSQTGVPLSVWKLDNQYQAAVIEAGISQPGEMSRLQRIIRPDTGIFTNIGDAHQENFTGAREKIREKLTLFGGVEKLIYPLDYPELAEEVEMAFGGRGTELAGWSFRNTSAPYHAEQMEGERGSVRIGIKHRSGLLEYSIPFSDRASVENSVSVAVACLLEGIPADVIVDGMAQLNQVAMRMAIKEGVNNCIIIEDYYNSDPGSLAMAIDFLKSQQGRKHTLILSDFLQTGRDAGDLAEEVADLVRRGVVGRMIGIGEGLYANSSRFEGTDARFFRSTGEFLSSFSRLSFNNETILLKGARVYEFERIATLLEQKRHTTVLEINLDAISRNLAMFRSMLNPEVRIMGMVKAFAYGSGISEIGSLLEYNRVDWLAVAYADEGVELRDAGITIPVMVMNPDETSYDILIQYNLEPEIYSFRVLSGFIREAVRHGLESYPVHVKIDTGMHRLGFLPSDVRELCRIIKGMDSIKPVSVFSHLAASEAEVSDSLTIRQATLFDLACSELSEGLGYMPLRHLLNSAGIIRFPRYQYEMVRPGIGLYGLVDADAPGLQQTSRYVSRISQIKQVRAGEPVGYGYSGISKEDRSIATIPVGYADGLSRQMGNGRGAVWIGGRRAPLVGNICMDMCMADITGCNASEGDQAEIFGENISIREVARICGTIPYEIITSIPPRVRRIFYHE